MSFLSLFQIPTTVMAADFSGDWEGPYAFDLEETDGFSGELTVNIIQNGNDITGTYTTNTGSSGTFSGVVQGEHFVGNITSSTGNDNASGRFVVKLKSGVLIVSGVGISDNQTRSVNGALTKNWVRNVNHLLSLTKESYPSNFMQGNLWGSIAEPSGKSIETVSLITPLGDEISDYEWDAGDVRFECGYSFDILNVQDMYPNGIYAFVMEFIDASSGVCFSSLAGNFPGEIPQIISPLPDALVDENSVLNVTWDQWTNPDPIGHVAVDAGNNHYTNYTNTLTQHEFPANSLSDNTMEEFSVSFRRYSGIYARKIVCSESYLRTTDHIVDDKWLAKAKIHLPSDAIAGALFVGMDAAGISGARLIPPVGASGQTLILVPGEKQTELWETDKAFADFNDLETQYPDGSYTLEVTYKDLTKENFTMVMGGVYPSVIPNITKPVNLSTLTWSERLTAEWTNWDDFGDSGTIINCSLSVIDSMTEDDYLSSSTEVWGEDEGISSDGATSPAGILRPGKSYAGLVMFINEVGSSDTYKATGDVVFFETPDTTSTLTISISGNGNGNVVSSDTAINCASGNGPYTFDYVHSQQIVLLVQPEQGSIFAGWTGDADCLDGVVDMSENRNCTARFMKSNIASILLLLGLDE